MMWSHLQFIRLLRDLLADRFSSREMFHRRGRGVGRGRRLEVDLRYPAVFLDMMALVSRGNFLGTESAGTVRGIL
jgi:hypothetical protein